MSIEKIKAAICLVFLFSIGCVLPVVICDILKHGWPWQ